MSDASPVITIPLAIITPAMHAIFCHVRGKNTIPKRILMYHSAPVSTHEVSTPAITPMRIALCTNGLHITQRVAPTSRIVFIRKRFE